MAKIKETAPAPKEEKATFSKDVVISSKKYRDSIDIINALWTDGSQKTAEEIDAMIDNFKKGKVK